MVAERVSTCLSSGPSSREVTHTSKHVGVPQQGWRTLPAEGEVLELRQYTLHPGRRADLIDLALGAFYGGPVWREHRDKFNDTMIDSDDVLLLRPSGPSSGFALTERPETEPAENNFPALPVRADANVFARVASFADEKQHHDHVQQLGASVQWTRELLPTLVKQAARPPERLHLRPTARSRLH